MNRMQTMAGRLGTLGVVAMALHAPPAAAFFDDFEDGDTVGWPEGTTGGNGSIGVEPHNGSLMAFARHSGGGTHSLSHDFTYISADSLLFDMHAVAVTATGAGGVIHAGGGVSISFFNQFNVALGKAALYNVTNTAALGPREYFVDAFQHHYGATMGDFASLAGLNSADPIAKVNLSVVAWGASFNGGNIYPSYASSATVWLDNVSVSAAVPEPQSAAAMLTGLALIALFVGRRRADGARREAAMPGCP